MVKAQFKVEKKLVGKRLDLAIVASYPKLSRRKAKTIIDQGGAYVNQQRSRIASRLLSFGDLVDIEYTDNRTTRQTIQLDQTHILYRNNGIIAINKPAGLPSQGTSSDKSYHVVNALKTYLATTNKPVEQLFLAHRLDKETTGILLLAESKEKVDWLIDQFRQRLVKKSYHALCFGQGPDSFTVQSKLSMINPKTGKVKASQKSGKDAITHFELVKNFEPKLSLINCMPVTGRSHQIRVHLANSKLPILGDKVYGDQPKTLPESISELASHHHLLHARSLEFSPGPDANPLKIKAPYSPIFKQVLALLDS